MTNEDVTRYLRGLERCLATLETVEFPTRPPVATDNVSNPPTDAELDTAFGQPAALGEGFEGIVDDAGAGANVWRCSVVSGAWWYGAALTKAV